MQGFTRDHRVMCLPPRALWGEPTPPAQLLNWQETLTPDLLDGLREHQLDNVIAVGHSFGGIASIGAVLREPSRFRALILLDPTIFAPEIAAGLAAMQADGSIHEFPLAVRASRRQREFASADEAFRYFRSRPLFGDWSDEAVRLYAEQGTVPSPNGVTLMWTPEWEAYYFKTGYTHTWDDLPKLRGLLPILIIRGGSSDTYIAESAERVKQILPEATHAEIPGHGHLFPQSNPTETYGVMRQWIDRLP
jgi:pimeloyl-ACP methyl ester carboxylesterase